MTLKIFVIAGEESGDILGASILSALPGAEITGIGGVRMTAAGLRTPIFPMEYLSVMGIAEILPKIFFFKKLINDTVLAAEKFNPDIVLSIDSPEFSFRVQRALRARGHIHAKQIHVVAPSVWAWRPGRAQKIAQFLDGLICLFPFEPSYFQKHGLRSISMGHPSIDGPLLYADPLPFRAAIGATPNDILLGVFPGSRAGVIKRHLSLFIEVLNILSIDNPNIQVVIPTFEKYADVIRAACTNLKLKTHIVTDSAQKSAAMRACQVGLSVTGTVGLELVIANVPHVAAYKMSLITWLFVKNMTQTKFAHLANIISGALVVPEFLQNAANPEEITAALRPLLHDGAERAVQLNAFARIRQSIGQGANHPAAVQAAEFIKSCYESPKGYEHA
jgi:lipid-A-disaccharide synthase